MDSKVVRADFGSGLICPGLKHAAPRLRGLRLGLQTRRGSNHSAAHVGESNSRSNVFQISCTSVCVPSRWKVLSGEFRRRPTALAIKFRKPDRVGRRGLSEPREDFSRLTTYVCPWLFPWLYFAAACALRIAPSDKARNMLPPAPQSSAIRINSRTSSSRSPRVKARVPSHSSTHDS